jgi:hypothetical protein
MSKYNIDMTKKEAGSLGDKATSNRYSSNYMSMIGYSGCLVNKELNFFNDHDLCSLWLRKIARDSKKTLENSDFCDSRR